MPRQLREDLPGAVHHVYARGNDQRAIYIDDADRRTYLGKLRRVVRWKRWKCLAYCLMDNHVHLVVETPRGNLAAGMQWLHSSYAQAFNCRHSRSGHLFQGRYAAVPVRSDAQLLSTVAYVVRNPVKAGLCGTPDEWPWSSHAAFVEARPPEWLDIDGLLSRLRAFGGDPRRRYAELTRG